MSPHLVVMQTACFSHMHAWQHTLCPPGDSHLNLVALCPGLLFEVTEAGTADLYHGP